jgi:hypothetical protein
MPGAAAARTGAGAPADVATLAAVALLAPPDRAPAAFAELAGALASIDAPAAARAARAAARAAEAFMSAPAPALPPPP